MSLIYINGAEQKKILARVRKNRKNPKLLDDDGLNAILFLTESIRGHQGSSLILFIYDLIAHIDAMKKAVTP